MESLVQQHQKTPGTCGIVPELSSIISENIDRYHVEHKVVCNIGCGSGPLIFDLINKGALEVHGVEPCTESLYKAKKSILEVGRYIPRVLHRIHLFPTNIENFIKLTPCTKKFELIVCNAAQLPLPRPMDFFGEGAYFQGIDGLDMIRSIVEYLPRLLKRNGEMYIILTDLINKSLVLDLLDKKGFTTLKIDSKMIPFYRHCLEYQEIMDHLSDRLIHEDLDFYFKFSLYKVTFKDSHFKAR